MVHSIIIRIVTCYLFICIFFGFVGVVVVVVAAVAAMVGPTGKASPSESEQEECAIGDAHTGPV